MLTKIIGGNVREYYFRNQDVEVGEWRMTKENRQVSSNNRAFRAC